MDTAMSESRSTGTQTNKRARNAADGAEQVGQGHLVTVPRNIPHLYNTNFTVRLTYADNYAYTLNQDGTSTTQIFRADSIFDPDQTGTGHQPLMRDLWASQYDYYAVLACEYQIKLFVCVPGGVTWTAITPNTQQLAPINATFFATTSSADITSMDSGLIYPAAEMKNTYTKFVPPDRMEEFSGTLTPADFIVDAKDQDDDDMWTAVGSNPIIPRRFGFVLSTAQQTALSGISPDTFSRIYAQVILHYDVQFTQMNQTLRATPS